MKKETLSEIPLSPDLNKTKMGKEEPADVEMKDAESPAADNEEPKKDADLLTLEGKIQKLALLSDLQVKNYSSVLYSV